MMISGVMTGQAAKGEIARREGVDARRGGGDGEKAGTEQSRKQFETTKDIENEPEHKIKQNSSTRRGRIGHRVESTKKQQQHDALKRRDRGWE
eukprot:761813-Hanusia_phi.AAC.4